MEHGCKQCDDKALEIVRLQEANTGLHDGLRRVMQILLETLGSDHKLIGGLRTPPLTTQDEIKGVVGV